MNEPFYISESAIQKVAGVHRRATLQTGDAVEFGVHGAIKEHYKLGSEPDLPLPVDYVVASAGG